MAERRKKVNYIFDNERPIYLQLVEKIRIEIISGKLKPGERIPSVRELALTARVNPNTMQKALVELEHEGLVYTERTNGKFVTDNKELIEKIKKELAQEKVNSFLKDMQNIGITYIEALKYLQELGGNE
jgi:DNA-binding transcriptional regulator YhcF (GntR family)